MSQAETQAKNIQSIEPTQSDAPTAPARLATVDPSRLLAFAMEQGADIDKLTKLFELQTQWEANQARKAFNESLAGFKSNPPPITKDKHVYYETSKGATDYWHASLANLVSVIAPALGDHGLSFRWHTNQQDGQIKVTCILSHYLGHQESVSLVAHADQSGGKNAIQAVGSSITYLQRYTLFAITGLAAGDDDDGRQGVIAEQEVVDQGCVSESQVAEINRRLAAMKISAQSLAAATGFDSVDSIPAAAYDRVINYLARQEAKRNGN